MDRLIYLGLIVLAIYLVIRLMTNVGSWMTGARYRAYRHLASRFHGKYETRGLSDPPTVSFTHNGATVRVGLAPTVLGQPGQIPRTRVVARFTSGIPFRMELAPKARPAPLQSPKGTRLVSTGDPKFDYGFVARANDAEMARDFLCAPIRSTVIGLQQVVHPGGMLVSINPERMLVQIDRNLGTNADSLTWVVQQALALHDGLIDGVTRRMKQGVDIVEDGECWDEDDWPARVQGLRRSDRRERDGRMRGLQHAPSPRLLGLCRGVLDLRLQRQGWCQRVTTSRHVICDSVNSLQVRPRGVRGRWNLGVKERLVVLRNFSFEIGRVGRCRYSSGRSSFWCWLDWRACSASRTWRPARLTLPRCCSLFSW